MYKKILCSLLIVGLLNFVCFSQVSNVKTTADTTTQIKEAVNKIGINHKVSIKLLNGKKINGFIKEIKDDSFVVVDSYKIVNNNVIAVDKTNSLAEIQFSQVKEIRGKGIGAGGKTVIIIFGVAMGAGVLFLISLVGRN